MKKRYPNVEFIDEKTTYIEDGVQIGEGTVIGANVSISAKTIIGPDNQIEENTVIKNMIIGRSNRIRFSYLEDSQIGDNNMIGPFAHIRGGSQIGSNNAIGNYVELKNVKMTSNNKALHLSYLGDTSLGVNNNIGAGTITANFNAKTQVKSSTTIKDNVAIGSNVVIVAPVTIDDKATVAAGSVITEDVPKGNLAIARQRQTNKDKYS